MWQQWVNAVLGLWVITLPFVGITGSAFMWTLTVTGIAIAILAVWGALEERTIEHKLHDLQLQHR